MLCHSLLQVFQVYLDVLLSSNEKIQAAMEVFPCNRQIIWNDIPRRIMYPLYLFYTLFNVNIACVQLFIIFKVELDTVGIGTRYAANFELYLPCLKYGWA